MAIAVLGVGGAVVGVHVPTVGDMGALPDTLPTVGLPAVPFDLETLSIIAPYAVTLAFVGLVATSNLALGVAGGVLLAAIFFARRVAHVTDVTSIIDPEDGRTRIYHVTGELFFASTNELIHLFDYTDDIDRAVVDLHDAHIWDTSAVAALDAVVAKFAAHDIDATVIGLNQHSADLHHRTSGHMASSH